MDFNWAAFATSFITLFIILDPFVSVGVFLGMIKGAKPKEVRKTAFTATLVAFTLLIVFLIIGEPTFKMLGIDFASFKVAGGIILLIMGIQQVLGHEFSKHHESLHSAAVVIGTPLLAGPGALSTMLVLERQHGFFPPLMGAFAVCAIAFIMLAMAEKVQKAIGKNMIEISSRVLGLLLAAIAVGFIKDGVLMMLAK